MRRLAARLIDWLYLQRDRRDFPDVRPRPVVRAVTEAEVAESWERFRPRLERIRTMYDYRENDPFRAQGEMDELRRRELERLRQGSASRARVEMIEAGHHDDPDAAVSKHYVWVGDTLQERVR